MVKSYSHLFHLLLILLFITVDTTVLAGILPPQLVSGLIKNIGWKAFKGLAKTGVDVILSELPPSQQLGKKIQGLSIIKQYLYNFGYLQQQSPSFDDILDEKTLSAINAYQKKFNLEITSDLNKETLQKISSPRCGVPDKSFEYTLSSNNGPSWPKGNKWFPKGKKSFTYGFESNIPPNVMEVFKNALMQWSTTTKFLTFTEATYVDANIKIGFYIYNEGVQDVVVGDAVFILQNTYPSGVIRLDASKYWLLSMPSDNNPSLENGEFDLETVAMHQIGHLLGLDHSFETNSIMYPIINQRNVLISDSDITNVNQLYNNANGNFGSSASVLTSLFLGFAFVAMFN